MPEAVDMINLGFLSESERELILEVLRRDEKLRQAEDQRVRKLKTELQDVKRKGAKRASEKYSQHSCGRCLEPLSRLTVFSSQCKMCNHVVCRNCRMVLPDGSWLCNVCAKESDVKKRTGDWFYNQRVNRFSTTPGHDLVRVSLRKKQPSKKRETAGEVLLSSSEINSGPPKYPSLTKQKLQMVDNSNSSSYIGSITSTASLESKEEEELKVQSNSNRSDTESVESSSIASVKTETESGRVTPEPEQPRKENSFVRTSPVGSSNSSLTVSIKADTVSSETTNAEINTAPEVKSSTVNPELDVDRLFKKSIKRGTKPAEYASTLDLRNERDTSEASLGKRSRSVPGLDIQEDEEEEEDIDSLVSFHRRTMNSNSSSLRGSKSTLGSMMSLYSEAGDFDSVEVKGDVVFSVSYDESSQSLQVFIKECHQLAYGDAARSVCNPYVKCYLLPDKSRQSKKKTSTKRNIINPVYSETLKYSINRSQLSTRSLSISVWHHGRLSRNAFLGEVEIPLDCRDLDSPQEERMALLAKAASVVPPSAFAQYKGELIISLKFVTPKKQTAEKTKDKKARVEEGGELHVLIKEAKNLMAMKSGGTSDSFVKGYLFPTKAKNSKRKTPVMKKSLNPHYNETFVYKELTLEQLKEMCLELTVWDKESLHSNEFLGGVRLSSGEGTVKVGKEEVELDSVGEEISLWQKMMQYPDSWAEGTLTLRSTMGKAKGK
ncbi:synaptotagmin-like protein 4 [Maylandia zebra]|uniref:synaptotagmin-like protein 4 n=1 Tax=Maylandia zebra TaxID=106582 RepID=UPI00403D4EE3